MLGLKRDYAAFLVVFGVVLVASFIGTLAGLTFMALMRALVG